MTAICMTAALSACSNDSPEAGRPETAPPVPTGSMTSEGTAPTSGPSEQSSAPPDRPATAEGLSLSAAEAFLGHYLALLNFAYTTGDTSPLLAASDKGCVGCKGTADYLAKVNGKNGGLSGDYADRLVEVKEIFKGASGRIGGSLAVQSGNYVERSSPSASPVQKKAHTETWQFTLSAAGNAWVMYEIEADG
ncbi:DUF6318 family protein [Kribbella italica]|uniref:DUF6318 family protein n=1 Tax=Kribbella italica TaxID=1540520 RepID=UPI003080AEA8